MHLYRLAIFIASILLVDAVYLSGNLSISYDPKPTLRFSTFSVKVDAKPNSDGSCYIHKMASGETCAYLIDKFTNVKSENNLNNWNKNSPGWKGCKDGHPWAGDEVCVSTGGYPDKRPSKNSDGSCATYTVVKGSNCDDIAKKYAPLSISDINKYNSKTFGWKGCNYLQLDQKICISDGTPPKPKANPKAECGPLAPGDLYNSKCALNACCSEFGFCGLTSEFCSKKKSDTGAPGTAGCVSNCGYGKQHTDTRGDFNKIVYWMDSDGKMASDPKELESDYDIMHYAFVNINSDFSIDDSKISISNFLDLNIKKVASFGGWDFSTNPSTYKIFRNIASSSGNREKFATNVVNFLKKYNLDGIDLDWEYPGAPDIPGIPADDKNNGKNYNELLKLIKSKLPSGKTLSIAIPASYWYLKNYPIKDMQANIDYQVFMTYDIHGTWDLDKDPHVKCHTNKTEVVDALKMLDKAGVAIGKTYGGLANYGRSYKLSSSSCTGVGCLFSGGGDKGPITETAGVLALSEIDDINSWATKGKRWTDDQSQCDFMTYNDNNVVAWPKAGQRTAMEDMFHNSGLKGSVLWAGNYFKHEDYSPTFGDCDLVEIDNNDFDIVCYYGQNKHISNKRANKILNKLKAIEKILFTDKFLNKIYNYLKDSSIMNKNKDNYYIKYRDTFDKIKSIFLKLSTNIVDNQKNESKLVDYEMLLTVLLPTTEHRDSGLYNVALDNLKKRLDKDLIIHWGSSSKSEINFLKNEVISNSEFYSGIVIAGNEEIHINESILDDEQYYIDGEDTFSKVPSSGAFWTPFQGNIDNVCGDDNKCKAVVDVSILQDGDQNKLRILYSNMISKQIERLPVFIVNINNQSPGVACNALKYISKHYSSIKFLGNGVTPVFRRKLNPGQTSKTLSRNSILGNYRCLSTNNNEYNFMTGSRWQRDEFPPFSVEEGMVNKKLEVEKTCVDAADNWIDGQNLERFFEARKPGKSNTKISDKLVNNDWTYVIPNIPQSGGRDIIDKGDSFYLLVNMKPNLNCALYTEQYMGL